VQDEDIRPTIVIHLPDELNRKVFAQITDDKRYNPTQPKPENYCNCIFNLSRHPVRKRRIQGFLLVGGEY
jgi:hypothetical protein